MDYCIYKTINGERLKVIHTFTQKDTFSRAKATARIKLSDMLAHVRKYPEQFMSLKEEQDGFSYVFQVTSELLAKARFYIAPAPSPKKEAKKQIEKLKKSITTKKKLS